MLLSTARRSVDPGAFLLDRRARDRAIAAKDAAVAALGPQHRAAPLAGVEADACIGRHRLRSLVAAMRAGDERTKFQRKRVSFHELPNRDHFRRSAMRYRVSAVS